MRICLHTLWLISPERVGGTERFLIDVSKELKALGHEPFILCPSLQEKTDVEGVEVRGWIPQNYRDTFVEMGANASGFMLKRLEKGKVILEDLHEISNFVTQQLAQVDADVIHLNSFLSALFVRDRRPIVVTNHENRDEYGTYLGENVYDKIADMILNRETELINHEKLTAPSAYYASEYSRSFDADVAPYNLGVCLNHFPVPDARRKAIQRRTREDQPLHILLPSRLKVWQKGHDVALDACEVLKGQGIDFRLQVSGINEKYRDDVNALFEMAEKRGVRKYVNARRYAKIQDAYEAADVVISPERYCSYGLSISEALSTATPTVLSDIPTYREIAQGYVHALFAKTGSADEFAHQILSSRGLSPKLLAEEGIRFRENNDLRHCARNFSQLYRTLYQETTHAS